MKKHTLIIISFALIAIFSNGCSPQYIEKSGKGVITKDNPTKYKYNKRGVFTKGGKYNKPKTTEFDYIAEIRNYGAEVPLYLVFKENDEMFYLKYPEAMTKYDYLVSIQSTSFSVPLEKANECWYRAISYVISHSHMNIDLQTDLIIQTYSPTKVGQKGFVITKFTYDQEVKFNVAALGNDGNNGLIWNSFREAQKCAYFMINGY